MRRVAHLSLSCSLALGLLAATAAHADTGTAWDDSHMRSNFARQRGPAPPRPPVQGASRYQQAAEAPTATPPTGVAETTLHLNPHGWTPGGPRASAGGGAPPWASPANGHAHSSGARPTTSAGVRGGVPGLRGSTIGGAQRSRR
jgi:hypothetical protein